MPVTDRLLGLAVFVLGGLVILLGGAALVGASSASKDSLAPSIRVPGQIRSGLLGAARPGHNHDVAQGHRAYLRRPASVAKRRFVAGSIPAPSAADSPGPGAVQPSLPALSTGAGPAPSTNAKPPPSLPVPKPNPSPDPEPSPEPPPPAPEPPPPAPAPPPPAPEPPPPPSPEPPPPPLLAANFENGLSGWNTAGVGEALPRVTTDIVREGDKSSAIRLTGEQDRSELILGGNGGGSTAGTIQFHEGDEYWYGFSFYIQSMVYGEPGAHNLIMQFKSADSGSPNFGLQLWDYAGDGGQGGGRGLWSHGKAMGGDRFLAPVPEQTWHDVVIHFKASSVGAGFYEVYLDSVQIDSRNGVSMIVPGAPYAYIKDGLYRNGEEIPGTSEIRLDAAKLGDTRESVQPLEYAVVEVS
jgi:Polysaccharide lyase